MYAYVDIGTAVRVIDCHENPCWRLYQFRPWTYLGVETDDVAFLCSDECRRQWLADWVRTDNNDYAYIRNVGSDVVRTADVAVWSVPNPDAGAAGEFCAICGWSPREDEPLD